MSVPLLFGPDGNTPIAMSTPEPAAAQQPISEVEYKTLLVLAFGALNGIAMTESGTVELGDVALQQLHMRTAALIVDAVGKETIERYYNIKFEVERTPTGGKES